MVDRPKLLVSACLLGSPVRYDGSAKTLSDGMLKRWRSEGRVVAACPELLGGLPVPRPPAEIAGALDGGGVLDGQALVMTASGADVTSAFVEGAAAALGLALAHGCRFALLTDGSPSCGGTFLHDGSFTGRRHDGAGVTAAMLRRHGVAVFVPSQMDELMAVMDGRPIPPVQAAAVRTPGSAPRRP